MIKGTRKVHFTDNSPSSDASSPSSSGPYTPPVYNPPLVYVYQPSPLYALSPIPPVSLEMHGILVAPTFDFNVSVDPAMNPVVYGHSFVNMVRNESATLPPVPSLSLVSPLLPWEISISSSVLPFVTVSDVLGGFYRALRLRVSKEEYQRESLEKQNAISLAYRQRHSRAPDARSREREKQAGVRRVDFLMGSHLLKGICKTKRPNVWNVMFKPWSFRCSPAGVLFNNLISYIYNKLPYVNRSFVSTTSLVVYKESLPMCYISRLLPFTSLSTPGR